MSTPTASAGKRQSTLTIPVWPGSLLLLVLVVSGMLIRFWAWVEMVIRILLFQFIVTASGDLLGPQLTFTNLYYDFPFTAVLQQPQLTSEGETVIMAKRLRLTLENIPVAGQAIMISEVQFVEPVVRFLWHDVGGGLVGFNSNFFTVEDGEQYTDSFSTVPSDFLRIRELSIVRGGLYFQLPSGGDMSIGDIETTLETTAKASSPGRYRIEFDVDRPPALMLDVDGWLDIDTATLDVDSFFGRVNIEQDKIDQLPRDLQKLFDAYKIAGDVRMRADGTIPFTALHDTHLDIELRLTDAHSQVGDYMLPIPSAIGALNLSDGVVGLDQMQITFAKKGNAHLSGHLHLEPGLPFDVAFDVDQVKLEYILANAGSDLHGYSGLIGAQGAVESRVDDTLGALSGHAFVTLAHGDLLNVPIVEGLEEAVVQQDDWPAGNDRGSMEMAFTPTRVELDDIVLEGDVLGVRGSGEINYDGGINFRFNAGPLERMQMNLGGLGHALGFVTDRLVTYQVTGTWSHPRFDGRLLGVGTRHRTRTESSTAGSGQ